jgi:hypothetical protein
VSGEDGGNSAPVDRAILEFLPDHLTGTRQVQTASIVEEGHLELRVRFAESYYPAFVTEAVLSVRWYTNDDFTLHYRKVHEDGAWECRWDRHPNPHNAREHFHPPPDAATPGEDASWPSGYRDVTSHVLSEVERRLADLWESGRGTRG